MLFPTTDFAIFFAVVFTANWLLNPYPRAWKLFMIAASFFFYSWWDWHYVFLLAASTTIACVGAAVLDRFEGAPETDRVRRHPRRPARSARLVQVLHVPRRQHRQPHPAPVRWRARCR